MESLVCHFSHLLDAVIWKQQVDPVKKLLVLELRDPETRTVSFQCIQLINGEIYNPFTPEEEDWWIGIEQVQSGFALIHHYLHEEQPVRNGLDCYSIPEWKLKWQLPEAQFLEISNSTVNILDSNESRTISLSTGEDIASEFGQTNTALNTQFPEQFPADHSHFKTVAQFLQERWGYQAVEGLEYLEHKALVLISYYLYTDQKLENYLLVMKDDGEVIFQDCLGTQLSGIALDTFFIYEEQLIFVKQKNEIISLLLG